MDATDLNIAQLTANSLVITENVYLNTMSVTSTMTVKITVMRKDVVCDLYNYSSHDLSVYIKQVI